MDAAPPDTIVLQSTRSKTYHPTDSAPASPTPAYHIFFIPGNPGLISYYDDFLRTLHQDLNQDAACDRRPVAFNVAGTSLGGFEIDTSNAWPRGRMSKKPPYTLQEQIQFMHGRIRQYVTGVLVHEERQEVNVLFRQMPKNKTTKVILIGHSVGAYILLEIMRRHQEYRSVRLREENFKIVGGILLFPTITDIAKSPHGLRFAVCIIQLFHLSC